MYHEGNPGAGEYVSWRKSWSTNPGERISRSMYHEGNPGARILGGVCIMKEILEHESWGEYVSWRKSWSTNPGGRMYHEGTLGEQISYEYVFLFFPKKTWSTVYVSWTENHQKPRENCFAHHSPGFPVSTFFLEKTVEEGKKHNLVWSTNVPGERISLENEFPWRTNFPGERILGKFPRKNCGEKHYGETTHLENPNLFLCAGKVLVRKPPWKIPICFYVLEKFWRENPPGKSQFVSIVCWKNSGEKTPSKNSGKQTSAICSLPRIVSVKLVVIGMVLQPVHKWS